MCLCVIYPFYEPAYIGAVLQGFDAGQGLLGSLGPEGGSCQVLELVHYLGAGYSLSVVAADGPDAGAGDGAVSQTNLDAGTRVPDRLDVAERRRPGR